MLSQLKTAKCAAVLLLLTASASLADVTPASLFTDHAVLQRGKRLVPRLGERRPRRTSPRLHPEPVSIHYRHTRWQMAHRPLCPHRRRTLRPHHRRQQHPHPARHLRRRSLALFRSIQHGLHRRQNQKVRLRRHSKPGTGNRRRQLSHHPHVLRRSGPAPTPRGEGIAGTWKICLLPGQRQGILRHRLLLRARSQKRNPPPHRHHHHDLRRQHRTGLDPS